MTQLVIEKYMIPIFDPPKSFSSTHFFVEMSAMFNQFFMILKKFLHIFTCYTKYCCCHVIIFQNFF